MNGIRWLSHCAQVQWTLLTMSTVSTTPLDFGNVSACTVGFCLQQLQAHNGGA